MKIEYRVREVTRYIVTKYYEGDGVSTIGEYANYDSAYDVGYALARADKERLNLPPGDMQVIYPEARGTQMQENAG